MNTTEQNLIEAARKWFVADAAHHGTSELQELRAAIALNVQESPFPEPLLKKGNLTAWAILDGSMVILARNKTEAREGCGYGGMNSIRCEPATMEQVRYYLSARGITELEEA